ncbi:hypothetical protein AGABI2DRAFT_200165 [Agaricus bisporus var. bisporus H97]|uniref:hypothetical protein n=1 Tax=Agaricus bisporus var. bisporus (strain H97 / ATCC MYA-4626 / FGSC 10389) TaxID=936046 RepID=UPI00029F65EF|nr:hypothetical protein AGABI2DRAFT_200165 [Agaricus bisporus var. bisporus H97]EKV50453.1 hypothetical protein AGABI2DRAFT_200165 [Agaricus bisporus var. bisporus H97]
MAYPPGSTYPIRQSSQYQQSLHTNYPVDQYPPQDFSHQSQATLSQPDSFSQDSSTHQDFHQQDSYPQSFQPIPHQNSFSEQTSFNQSASQAHHNPPIQPPQLHPQLIQQQRLQYPQPLSQHQQQHQQQQHHHQQQPYPLQIQQPQAQFPQQHVQASYPLRSHQPFQDSQYAQSSSSTHQGSYTQASQQSSYPPQLQNSPVQLDQYSHFNQATPPNAHSPESSLVHAGQFSSQANQPPSAFAQQARQQQYTQFLQTHSIQQAQQQSTRNASQSTPSIQRPTLSQPPNPLGSQTLPYQSPQQPRPRQEPISKTKAQHSSGNVAGTYQLFFTGRDDPRGCMLIGEDTKPVHLAFETQENNVGRSVQTFVYRNDNELCAILDWGTGGFLGNVKIGSRQFPMSQLVTRGSTNNARGFTSSENENVRFEWRRMREDMAAYDLFMLPDTRIALFRKYNNQNTPVGPTHGLIQYTFSKDILLLEALLSLLLNRWIDMHGIQFSG